MEQLNVGEPATLLAHWTDVDEHDADPNPATLTIIRPNGATITKTLPDLIRDSQGHYRYVYVTDLPGVLEYNYAGEVNGLLSTETGYVLVGENIADGPLEPWTTWEQVAAQPILKGLDLSVLDVTQQQLIVNRTSELLWNLSERAYPGIGKTTRSLCVRCASCSSYWWWGPTATDCGCAPTGGINLRGRYPILSVRQIVIDGNVLDPAAYRLENQSTLVRTDGESWPVGKDLTDASAFLGTWFFGAPVPAGGVMAAQQLAGQSTLAALSLPCLLPQYMIKDVTVEGITYKTIDASGDTEKRRTGFQPADEWLDSLDVGTVVSAGFFDPGAHDDVTTRAI